MSSPARTPAIISSMLRWRTTRTSSMIAGGARADELGRVLRDLGAVARGDALRGAAR